MLTYAARRLLFTLPVLWAATTLCFVLVRAAPGDPVDIMFGPSTDGASAGLVTKEQKDARRRELGIDRPLPAQYVAWLGRVAHGDLGRSFKSRRPVRVELQQRLPATAALAAGAFAVEIVVALGLGAWAALKVGTLWDHATRIIALILVAAPSFWLGLLLLWVFAVRLQWVTVAGVTEPKRLVLPALTLGLVAAPTAMRVLRASLLAELGRLHIAFARAKGLPERLVLWRHGLRMALLPVVTLLGLSLTGFLGGAVLAETVFSWPGIGKLALDSIAARDYPVVQGYVLLVTAITIGGSLAVDLLYAVFDPRVRAGATDHA
jgi:ABC-type dipeptide/oligopeptide/nickel transport system permease component